MMQPIIKCLGFLVLFLLSLNSCAGVFLAGLEPSRITIQDRQIPLGTIYSSRSPDCAIEVFRSEIPSKEFLKISRIDVHIERTYYIRTNFEEALPELKIKACESGADAIIDIQERSSYINNDETHIYHVIATGIKYTQ